MKAKAEHVFTFKTPAIFHHWEELGKQGVTRSRRGRCKLCTGGQVNIPRYSFPTHMATHHLPEETCDICGEECRPAAFKKHWEQCDGTEGVVRGGRKGDLHLFWEEVEGEGRCRKGRCLLCTGLGPRLLSYSNFTRHMQIHLPAEQCKVCGSSVRPHAFRKHQRECKATDLGAERRFQCKQCDKAFVFKHHLVEHARFHTGEKQLECKFCHLRFSLSDSYYQHLASKKCQTPNALPAVTDPKPQSQLVISSEANEKEQQQDNDIPPPNSKKIGEEPELKLEYISTSPPGKDLVQHQISKLTEAEMRKELSIKAEVTENEDNLQDHSVGPGEASISQQSPRFAQKEALGKHQSHNVAPAEQVKKQENRHFVSGEEKVKLVMIMEDKPPRRIAMTIKASSTVQKAMKKFAQAVEVSEASLKFTCGGKELSGSEVTASLEVMRVMVERRLG